MNAATWRVGLRWASDPTRWRTGRFWLVVAAVALAGVAACGAIGVAAGIPVDPIAARHLIQRVTALVLLGTPSLLLLAAVARMTASARDRKLAQLRLLGVPSSGTRLISALETLVPVAIGLLAALVVAAVTTVTVAQGAAVVIVGLVIALAAGISGGSRADLEVTRTGRESTPSKWRLVPLVPALIGSAALTQAPDVAPYDTWAFQAGVVMLGLALIGLVVALPLVTYACAGGLARLGPAGLLAARWIQAAPASVGRAVTVLGAALAAMVVIMTFVEGVLSDREYRQATAAVTTGPAYMFVFPDHQNPQAVAALTDDPRVLGVAAWPTSACEVNNPDACVFVYYGDCEQLRIASLGAVTECPTEPTWIGHPGDYTGIRQLLLVGAEQPVEVVLPRSDQAITGSADSLAQEPMAGLYLPQLPAQARPATPESHYVFQIEPGRAQVAAFQAAANVLGLKASLDAQLDALDRADNMRSIVASASAALILVALAWLLIATVDRGAERAPLLARLSGLGIPAKALTAATLLTALTPALAGIALAAVTGHIAAMPFVAQYPNTTTAPPGNVIAAVAVVATIACLLLATAAASTVRTATRAPMHGDI